MTTREAIMDLLGEGLSLEQIAFIHGMTSTEGLRDVVHRTEAPAVP